MEYDGETVIGEIKTAKQEVWDTRQAEMKSSAFSSSYFFSISYYIISIFFINLRIS